MQVTFILPCRNKEKLIKSVSDKVIQNIKNLIKEEKISDTSHLLLIDNASKDNSWYEIGKVVARNPFIAKAKKLKHYTKNISIAKNNPDFILLNFKDNRINLDNLNKLGGLNFLNDILKSSKYDVTDELS